MLLTGEYDEMLGAQITREYRESIITEGADLPPHIAQEIIRNIRSAEKRTLESLPRRRKPFSILRHWAAAAAVLICIAGAAWIFALRSGHGQGGSLAGLIPDSMTKKTNATAQPLLVALEDGSTVLLQPQATIHYPQQFAANGREVYLEGDAFFKVAKNPYKPFYVYYNNVVTKVLGTSFHVGTNRSTGNVEVAVQTGRVQVYENEKLLKARQESSGVIITPNEKAIYKADQRIFEATLVEDPQPVAANGQNDSVAKAKANFVFEHIRLADLFKQLEKRYAIEIVVENEGLYNCMFSGDVSQQDLYGKLKIICLTTDAAYEINGTRILIKGKGCN
jgi:ferric-dicitrate binding protein FerR (iron transport regulator)